MFGYDQWKESGVDTATPIQVGDPRPQEGIAMKSQPLDLGGLRRQQGTLVGKALALLDSALGTVTRQVSMTRAFESSNTKIFTVQ